MQPNNTLFKDAAPTAEAKWYIVHAYSKNFEKKVARLDSASSGA